MMSLYVSSHYKNSPNDLQLLSDAPAHHLFVLLGPVDSNSEGLPDVLAVVQVCLEGAINRESVKASLSRGIKQSGDLIPWTVSQQYQDHDFPGLSGARIVRIAVHPDAQRMGYGSRALELIKMYYEGHFANLSEASDHVESNSALASQSGKSSTIHDEVLEPRKNLPPLMEALTDRPPESLHWLGTSYGVTQSLYNFWKKSGFKSVYLRQTENELTGEHSCIMIRNLEGNALNDISNASWLENFTKDFQRRFMTLLSYNFRNFEAALGLSILDPSPKVVNASALHQLDDSQDADDKEGYSWELLKEYVTDFDLQRLDAYSRNLVDYHMILDLIPDMAKLVFLSKAPVSISHAQAAILLAVGLQRKSIDDVEKEFHLMSNQILATFNKVVKKVSSYLKKQRENGIKETLPETKHTVLKPLATSLQSELSEAAQEISEHLKQKQNELIKSIDVDKYAVGGTDQDWNNVLKSSKEAPSTISVKSNGQKKRFIPNFNSEKGKDKNKSSKKMKIKSGHGVK
jgi:N-acetyltransferase 10